jgi:D-alanyl-D-alanine carboxypeptidase
MASGDTTRLASVSKAFNGAVALALVSQGQLSLTDAIGKWLPSLPAAWASVTLAQLLQHTGGVPDYIKSPAFLSELQSDPQAVMTPAQLLGFVATEPLDFPPGSRYEYSDSDNIVVGLMIEAATGSPYESALAKYVTTPLHLAKTTLPANAQMAEPYVHGYSVEAGKPPEDDSTALNPGLAWASGGMNSTIAELNTFMRAYVSGQLFDAATQKQQRQFVPGDSGPPGPGTNSAGLAVFRYQTPCGTVYGHSGNYPGYTAFSVSNLQGTRSVAVIVNEQLNAGTTTTAFTQLRHVWELGVCAALAS